MKNEKAIGIQNYHNAVKRIMTEKGVTRKQALVIYNANKNGEVTAVPVANVTTPAAGGMSFARMPDDLIKEAVEQSAVLKQTIANQKIELAKSEEALEKFEKIASVS